MRPRVSSQVKLTLSGYVTVPICCGPLDSWPMLPEVCSAVSADRLATAEPAGPPAGATAVIVAPGVAVAAGLDAGAATGLAAELADGVGMVAPGLGLVV